MVMGVGFALLSLVFAGLNDVVFKRYSQKDRSRGMYIFGVGIVWTALQLALFFIGGHPHRIDEASLWYGLAAGTLLVISNIALLESLTHIDISLCSTIYRLNTIGVVLLSLVFLDESMGITKASGILLGILAVIVLFQRPRGSAHAHRFPLFFGIAVIASGLRALYGVTTKLALNNAADPDGLLVLIAASWIIGGAVYARVKEKRFRVTVKKAQYSAISGVLVFMIVNFLMSAVKYGDASVVIPIANMSFVVALAISAATRMEIMTTRKGLAIVTAVASILLLSRV